MSEVSGQFGIDGRQAPLGALVSERRTISLMALLVVNLVPLLGVIFWGWDVASVMILYWSENLIIGFYTIIKMLVKSPLGGIFMSAFFTIHYGGFCAVHGLFVLSLTTGEMADFLSGDSWPLFLVFVQLLLSVVGHVLSMAPPEWIFGFAALGVSHGVSLLLNYFAGGEDEGQDLKKLMQAPYKRVVVLHVAIIAGAFGVAAFESPLPLLVMLVILKTGLDVWLHRREHAPRPEPEAATGP